MESANFTEITFSLPTKLSNLILFNLCTQPNIDTPTMIRTPTDPTFSINIQKWSNLGNTGIIMEWIHQGDKDILEIPWTRLK